MIRRPRASSATLVPGGAGRERSRPHVLTGRQRHKAGITGPLEMTSPASSQPVSVASPARPANGIPSSGGRPHAHLGADRPPEQAGRLGADHRRSVRDKRDRQPGDLPGQASPLRERRRRRAHLPSRLRQVMERRIYRAAGSFGRRIGECVAEGGARGDPEFGEHLVEVGGDRSRGEEEPGGDLFVGVAGRREQRDLALLRGE